MPEQSPDRSPRRHPLVAGDNIRRLPGETRQNLTGSDNREFNEGEHHESAPR
jgi:hypothetical protein